MNASRYAVIVTALGLTLSGPLAWAHGQGAATSESAKQAQADHPAVVAGDDAANTPKKSTSDEQTTRNAKKHPPTARMDSATPPEKVTPDADKSAMHPPTGRMDRATPAEKSPGSDDGKAAERSPVTRP